MDFNSERRDQLTQLLPEKLCSVSKPMSLKISVNLPSFCQTEIQSPRFEWDDAMSELNLTSNHEDNIGRHFAFNLFYFLCVRVYLRFHFVFQVTLLSMIYFIQRILGTDLLTLVNMMKCLNTLMILGGMSFLANFKPVLAC